MVEQLSPELKTLRSEFNYLVSCISVSSILPEARATELITVREYEECRAERTDYSKADTLMKYVERAVTAKAANFNLFLSILNKIGQTAVAARLREALEKPGQHPSASTTQQQQPSTSGMAPLNAAAPKMNDLLDKVAAKARDKWKQIGMQLNMDYSHIRTITSQDPIICYAEVFETWRKSGSPPYTWATIIDALRAPSVGEHQLANELQEWLTNQ